MKGDFSRLTFDPARRYDSVRMQQGRVQVDADWNEQADIQTWHREQALRDLIGDSCAPDGNAGFAIAAAGGDLTISQGRLYVDGILCEQPDPGLTFLTQPDYPGATVPALAGTYLAYLDVWKWHVTALENPAIRETALGGPDTATRLKTVCQVKLQPVAAGAECRDVSVATPAPGGLAARSQPEDDPESVCVVPATAGYTRLENHLYRVEVHEGGELGVDTPTFKWSRNNGSIVTEWLSQQAGDPNRLVVRSTGRDALLGFHDARWVELTDDDRELRGEAGLLVEVVAVEDDVIEIDPGTLTVDIADFNGHPKVRRWDMDTDDGAIPIAIAPDNDGYLRLESGVQVLFGAGHYRTGDYWLIPARAFIGEFQGDIEWPLDPATTLPAVLPPRGIAHHYAKLAIVSFDGTDFAFEEDCRHTFDGLCGLDAGCCTMVVAPGEDIQAAIDALPPEGGCVCLKAGEHVIDDTLRIERADVALRGESTGARVSGSVLPLLTVGGPAPRPARVAVQGIRFEAAAAAGGGAPPAVIALQACDDVQILDCGILSGSGQSAGITLADTDRITIRNCRLQVPMHGVWVLEDSLHLRVEGSHIDSPALVTGEDSGLVGVFLELAFAPCTVSGNTIEGFQVGIAVSDDPFGASGSSSAHRSEISGNEVRRRSSAPAQEDEHLFAIDVAAGDCRIHGNRITLGSSRYGGIRALGARTRIEANTVESGFQGGDTDLFPLGIRAGAGNGDLPADALRLCGNGLYGAQDAIAVFGGSGVLVAGNEIGGRGGRLRSGIALDTVHEGTVRDNRIADSDTAVSLGEGRHNRVCGNRIEGGGAGIVADQDTGVEISDNELRGVSEVAITVGSWLGTARVLDNRCVNCGSALASGSVAIAAYYGFGELQIEQCDVRETGVSPEDGSAVNAVIDVLGFLVIQASLQSNNIGAALGGLGGEIDPAGIDHRAVYLLGLIDYQFADIAGFGFPAQLLGNRFAGIGNQPVVQIDALAVSDNFSLRFNRVQYSDNFHWHLNGSSDDVVTVRLRSASASAVGNHFKSFAFVTPIDFGGTSALYMGNSAQGADASGSSILPTPQNAFNR